MRGIGGTSGKIPPCLNMPKGGKMGWITRLNGKGRLVIPGQVRERLGLERGDNLVLEIKGNEIVLYTYAAKVMENSKKDDLEDFLSKKMGE